MAIFFIKHDKSLGYKDRKKSLGEFNLMLMKIVYSQILESFNDDRDPEKCGEQENSRETWKLFCSFARKVGMRSFVSLNTC